jgi:hypothetical protein
LPVEAACAKVIGVRLPRKGILIRLAIYLPILAFLSWRAGQKWMAEQHPEPTQDGLEMKLEPHKRMITLPDGTQQPIYEMTQAEAEQLLGPLPTSPSMSKGEPTPTEPAKAEPAKADAPTKAVEDR